MSPLRSPVKVGQPRGWMPGARRVRRMRGALAVPHRVLRLHPVRHWRKLVWLLIGPLALALLGILAALSPDRPEVEPPRLDAPSVQVPKPSLPGSSLPDGSGDTDDRARPERQGPEHRMELTHDHRYHLVWMFSLPLVLLALAGLVVLYPFARLPRWGQHVFGGMVAASLIALSVSALAAGVNPQPGPGTYEREPAEIERSDDALVKRIHVRHFHEPIDLIVPWLLLGFGLAILAVPGARIAAAGRRKPPARKARQAMT